MILYLSSYKFGDYSDVYKSLFTNGKKVALISNALDFSNDIERRKSSEESQIKELEKLGLIPSILDLRNYFDSKTAGILDEFDGVWVMGGNTFVLNAAYKLSGLDTEINRVIKSRKDFVYGGYSAGVCVLQESLKGTEIVDDISQVKETYGIEPVWSGLGLIDYIFVPHFESDHPESEDVSKEIEYYKQNEIKYRYFHDGEVLLSNVS